MRQATRVEIDEERIEDFREKILKDGEFDAYCLDCCKKSHFKGHLHSRTKDKFLLKIGQSPSMADLQLFDIKKYKHYLPTIVI